MLKVADSPPQKKSPLKKGVSKSAKPAKPPRQLNYEKLIHGFNHIKPRYMKLGLLVPVIGVAVFGLMMVYSASWYNSLIYYNTRFHFFNSQLIGFILGLLLMSIAYMVDYRVYKKWYLAIYAVGLILLVLVFVPGIGITRLGASRWIGIGGFTMQPSEIAKFTFVIFAAAIATGSTPFKRKSKLEKSPVSQFPKGGVTASDGGFSNQATKLLSLKQLALILGAGLSYCALILLEPNLSITLVLGATTFVALFLFGAKIKHLACVLAPALVALPVMLVAEPYRVRRLLAFIDPWANPKDEGFQLIQSLFGLGNGGLFGVGFGNSTQKHMFLPFAESDFIFSIIGEEFGFIGSVLFIITLGLIVTQIFRVGMKSEDRFAKFLCFGIATVIFIQSAVNLAVVTGTIPPTGVPLPFISFGGTSLAVMMSTIGIVLNVEKQNRRNLEKD